MNSTTTSSALASSSSLPPTADAISRRAYEIWEREGRPDGCDSQHWLQAEKELKAEGPAASAPEPSPQPRVNPTTVDQEMRRTAPAGTRKRESNAPFSSRRSVAAGK